MELKKLKYHSLDFLRISIPILIIGFIILLLFLLTNIFLSFSSESFQYSIFLYFGFILIILTIYLFFHNNFYGNDVYFQLEFLSEISIKLILFLSMLLIIFIPPLPFSQPLIIWDQIKFLNIIKGISFTIILMFLPGSCIFNLFLKDIDLVSKFKTDNFLVKITIYPLLSIFFIGSSIIILDFIKIESFELFSIVLVLEVIILYVLDTILTFKRWNKKPIKKNKFWLTQIKFSKTTSIILIISIGISLISIGINLSMKYLIPGDAWGIFRFADSLDDLNKRHSYPYFWSYTSFGFSILSGLPLINVNVLLAPFCYLYVMTFYFFFKALLYKFKDKYAILSTIFVSIYSGFYFWLNLNPLSDLVLFGEFYFNYKGVALYFIFFALAIFIFTVRNNDDLSSNGIIKNGNFKLIIFSAFFIMISYMTYIIPLLTGLIFIIIYILFSNSKNNKSLYMNTIILIIILITFFVIYDILTNFNQSFLFYILFVSLLKNFISPSFLSGLIQYLIYIFIFGILILAIIIMIIKSKLNSIKISIRKKYLDYLFYLVNLIFFCFLMVFIFLNIFDFRGNNSILYYIDLIFSNISLIGVIAVFLSYYCFQKDKNLFKILIFNILFSILYASIIFIRTYGFYVLPSIFPQDFSQANVDFSFNWFSRNWIYAIPSFTILASIGIISLKKRLKRIMFFKLKNKGMASTLKLILTLSLITILSTNYVFGGLYWGNKERQIKDSEVEFFSWIHEKFPENSTVLTEVYLYRTITYFGGSKNTIFFYEFEKNLNGSLNLDDFRNKIIPFLKEENINYFIHYKFEFIEDNKDEIRISKIYRFLTPEILSNIENYLIPNFYNQTIYENKDLTLHYAPYFNFTYNS